MFEELFLTDLEELERSFILSEEDILWELEKEKIESLDNYNLRKKAWENYKRHLIGINV